MVPNTLKFNINVLISKNGNLLIVGKTDVNGDGESHSTAWKTDIRQGRDKGLPEEKGKMGKICF